MVFGEGEKAFCVLNKPTYLPFSIRYCRRKICENVWKEIFLQHIKGFISFHIILETKFRTNTQKTIFYEAASLARGQIVLLQHGDAAAEPPHCRRVSMRRRIKQYNKNISN
jgi:hypothetical protein